MRTPRRLPSEPSASILVFGVGAFTHGVMRILREQGARVAAYLTRPYGHFGPGLEGPVYDAAREGTPFRALERERPDLVVPMSIDWAVQPWAREFLARRIPILCPVGEALRLERDRDFARRLCRRFRIPFPESYRARDRAAALRFLRRHPRPFVIKNPLCSPFSPVHTIVCESIQDTRAWLERVDDAEGVFLQAYLGRAEVGHIALVTGGEIHSLVTNQEYKRAFDGNLGIVAGAPLGGLVERDPGDRYGLARSLLHPLKPWFRATGFHGPVQVTAILHRGRWHVLEYNVRLGVTSGPLILRLLEDPVAVLRDTARNLPREIRFRPNQRYGCSITLAGYGYPYVSLEGPRLPVTVRARGSGDGDGDIWWNEVTADAEGGVVTTGHRIADVSAIDRSLTGAIRRAYATVGRIHSTGSYHRRDIGQSLWPPGRT